MSNKPKLIGPTKPQGDDWRPSREAAAAVAAQVLITNRLPDFNVVAGSGSEWRGYYLFSYELTADPNLRYGGGASLVVRKQDGLGGMVYLIPDFLEEDIDVICAPIPPAYAEYDAAHSGSS